MNIIHKSTLSVLMASSGVFECKTFVTLEQMKQVYAFAKRHAVSGLVANAVQCGMVKIDNDDCTEDKTDLLMLMMGDRRRLEQFGKEAEDALEQLVLLFQAENVDFVIFKGLAVAANYVNPEARNVGDVDFFVPKWDYERAQLLIERRLDVQIERCKVDKHDSFCYKRIRFEMHYQMETFGCPSHQRYFDRLAVECIRNGRLQYFELRSGVKVPYLDKDLDLMLVFKHMFNHLIGEGVGLRQLTDVVVLLKTYSSHIDIECLRKHLKKIGYLKAFDAMVALAGRYYIVKWEEYKRYLTATDFNMGDVMMADVLKNGNFGRSKYRNSSGWQKRMETMLFFFSNCRKFFRLAPWDIACLIPRRICISLRAH